MYIYACDREDDSRAVKAEYVRTGTSQSQYVLNEGDQSDCEYGVLPTVVYKHRIIEINPWGASDYAVAIPELSSGVQLFPKEWRLRRRVDGA